MTKLTPEQQTIVDHVLKNPGLTLINSVAGSGKTTLLCSIALALQPKSGLYLAYNKSVAVEASHKFPQEVHCSTTHSLAWKAVVAPNRLKVGDFTYRNIISSESYDVKSTTVLLIKEFCLSGYTDFEKFIEDNDFDKKYYTLGAKYLDAMQTGAIECTHEFYLKLYHILLACGKIKYDEFDFIALDEAGDLNEVTLEIFKLLPAKRKLMVGDPHQNIYAFNHTVNCFSLMKDEGTTFPMSQSFRVADNIASSIETFCQTYLAEDMSFKGIPIREPNIKTRAFISRTNASLIGKMIELNELGISYGLTRTPYAIFELPLIICGLKYKGFVANPSFRHLQEATNAYYENHDLQQSYKSHLGYLKALYKDDIAVSVALNLILRYGKPSIIACHEESRKHKKATQSYILGTCHSTKGLEFDEVTLADDLNDSIAPIIASIESGRKAITISSEERTELNLYYVACSRAKQILNNAKHL